MCMMRTLKNPLVAENHKGVGKAATRTTFKGGYTHLWQKFLLASLGFFFSLPWVKPDRIGWFEKKIATFPKKLDAAAAILDFYMQKLLQTFDSSLSCRKLQIGRRPHLMLT